MGYSHCQSYSGVLVFALATGGQTQKNVFSLTIVLSKLVSHNFYFETMKFKLRSTSNLVSLSTHAWTINIERRYKSCVVYLIYVYDGPGLRS